MWAVTATIMLALAVLKMQHDKLHINTLVGRIIELTAAGANTADKTSQSMTTYTGIRGCATGRFVVLPEAAQG